MKGAMIDLLTCVFADQAGNIYYARRRINEDFLAALHTEFLKNGARILRRAGEENPATFLKVLAQLVPRELQVENSGSIISEHTTELYFSRLRLFLPLPANQGGCRTLAADPKRPSHVSASAGHVRRDLRAMALPEAVLSAARSPLSRSAAAVASSWRGRPNKVKSRNAASPRLWRGRRRVDASCEQGLPYFLPYDIADPDRIDVTCE